MDIIRRPKKLPPQKNSVPGKTTGDYSPRAAMREIYLTPDDMEKIGKHEKVFKKGRHTKKIIFWTLSAILLTALLYGGYFFLKAYQISKKMDPDSKNTSLVQDMRSMMSPIIPSSSSPLDGESDGRINILLLGAAGQNQSNTAPNLTDTIMVMSIDTAAKKIALLSIPRDLYVNVSGTQNYAKINSLYEMGLTNGNGADLIQQKIEEITGIKINYYLAIDFDAFTQVIDDVGGVNVMVQNDLYDARYPGPNYSYETFSITKGFHQLDGATALQYVRERHGDPQGDFGRALRQQQVIQAVKEKLFSMDTFFNAPKLNDVLNTLGDNITTNISFDNIDSFIKLSHQLDTQNITNVVVDAWKPDSLLKVSHVQMGDAAAFVLLPRVGNYSEIQDLAQNIFDQDELQKRQDAIAAENATINIINQSGDNNLPQKISALLTQKLNFKNVTITYGNTGTLSDQTQVYDSTNGTKLFSIDELVKKLPASLASDQAPIEKNPSDITIVLGKDLIDTYKYDEASPEEYHEAQQSESEDDF